ncbi:DUF6284 family protein [Phytohabitans houttuyneae]|uniref:Uncharacterized protein n=1 Tax=Phytohabitans houttuyneae TaxID=1076126 RepID=A0A6V8KBM2_9ACTN|nr:DUF6284 family protein [Phytohabitans houttuyneae]GFJ79798.1 hypothetical protein Phou_039780 [Phytohabitans houttuyneae]
MDTFDVPALAKAGPTVEDLAAITAEWPLIEAELDLLDAEIRIITTDDNASDLDWRRLRRAETRVLREATAFYGRASSVAVPHRLVA